MLTREELIERAQKRSEDYADHWGQFANMLALKPSLERQHFTQGEWTWFLRSVTLLSMDRERHLSEPPGSAAHAAMREVERYRRALKRIQETVLDERWPESSRLASIFLETQFSLGGLAGREND